MVRSAEFFGLDTIYIVDKNGLLDDPKNKAQRADMNHLARVWTAGAVDHINIEMVINLQQFLKQYTGRPIATVVDERATPLHQFKFRDNDLIIMGPEKEGLPFFVRALCDEKVFLPNKGTTDCLNVSVMLGIALYASQTE